MADPIARYLHRVPFVPRIAATYRNTYGYEKIIAQPAYRFGAVCYGLRRRQTDRRPDDRSAGTGPEFSEKHFSTLAVNQVTVESRFIGKKYEVTLAGGGEIEFDKNGNWTKIDCRRNAMPESAVPGKILQYVKLHYPDYFVSVIEKEDGGYEVEMRDISSGHDIDLVFNGRQEFVRID